MTELLRRGRLVVRQAAGPADLRAAQALRHLCFVEGGGRSRPGGLERDAHDSLCTHVLVQAEGEPEPLACFRVLLMASGADLSRSYAARFYDLQPLAGQEGPLLELGRFCIRPGVTDPDVLRLAWGALTVLVDRAGVRMLFGCSSFPGTEPARHRAALALLGARHVAPEARRPDQRAAETVDLQDLPPPDAQRALKGLPPLLRSYLRMGGVVGDHAVIDRDLGTLHVFTSLETARIPPARVRALRAVAR